MSTVNEKMTAIADNIRRYTETTEKLNLDQMADAVHDVFTVGDLYGYGVGYEDGHAEGVEQGVEEGYWVGHTAGAQAGYDRGKQEQYDAFWYNFQQNGNRRDYNYGFVGYGFNADNFYPKYNIVLEGNNTYTFGYWNYGVAGKTTLNLKERLEECGVVLDTSKATGLTAMFSYSDFTEIPTINCSSLTTATTNLFNGNGKLTKIEKIITHKDVTYANWFRYDTLLVDVTFEGEIGQNIDFRHCPNLSKASIMNIVERLSTTSSGKTVTFETFAVNYAFTTDEWNALKATRTNWTFSLA